MSKSNETGASESRWALSPEDLKRLSKEAKAYKGESLWSDAWRRLRRNRTAFLALLFLAAFGGISLIAPFLPIPSPIALSLRDDAAPPQWFWEEPLALPKPPAPGTGMTQSKANLWNDGWRHRTMLTVAAQDEASAEAAKARIEEVAGRSAALEIRDAEDAPEGEAPKLAYVSVPHLRSDAPDVIATETDFRGNATVWRYDAAAVDSSEPDLEEEGSAEENTAEDGPTEDSSVTAEPDWRVVCSLELKDRNGSPFDPDQVTTWSVDQRTRKVELFLTRKDAVEGLGSWIVRFKLKEAFESSAVTLRLNGQLLEGSLPMIDSTPVDAQIVEAQLFKGVEHDDLGRRLKRSFESSPIAGAAFVGARHESGYWPFKGIVGKFDDLLLAARIKVFGLWQTGNWMGTDSQGRDLMSRIVWGSRTSIIVELIASLCSLLIGVLYGAFSGLMGGRIDNFMMRVVDVLYSIPFIFVVIFLITLIGDYRTLLEDKLGLDREKVFYIVIGAIYWLTMARVVRGQVLSLKNTEFIEAARVIGASTSRILLTHIVPNVLSIVIVYLTLTIPAVMLFEAFLSFLGLGIEPPKVSWGLLAVDGTQAINPIKIYWWLVVFPSLAMGTTLLALNVLGDGLRDALDPKLRGKS